ncbi:MAG: hypothetical protein ACUVXA_11065 [Candidatus Jordarchaeum sp.]|uniref:hypothetical protein n=1 Tax=Candidatus Jordarchaeum sp. TaxID=2823881 RepID=UPI00404B2BFE
MSNKEVVKEDSVDFEPMTMFIVEAVRRIESLFGPAFTKMIAKYALEFHSEKTSDPTPANINDLEEVTKYIMETKSKYPRGYNSLIFGIAMAEKKFEGASGSGSKNIAYNVIKKMIEDSGVLEQLKGKTEDIFEALKEHMKLLSATKIGVPQRVVRESDSVILDEMFENCPHKDVCRKMVEEGVTRMVGGQECVALIGNTAGVSIITGKPLDYKLDTFDQPHCVGRIFEI